MACHCRWTAASVAAAVGRVSQVKASAGTQFTYFDHAQPWADLYDPDYMPGGDVDAACILLKQGCEETSTWTDHTRIDATRAYYYKTIKVSSLDESLQQQVAPLDCLVRCCEAAAGWQDCKQAWLSPHTHYPNPRPRMYPSGVAICGCRLQTCPRRCTMTPSTMFLCNWLGASESHSSRPPNTSACTCTRRSTRVGANVCAAVACLSLSRFVVGTCCSGDNAVLTKGCMLPISQRA